MTAVEIHARSASLRSQKRRGSGRRARTGGGRCSRAFGRAGRGVCVLRPRGVRGRSRRAELMVNTWGLGAADGGAEGAWGSPQGSSSRRHASTRRRHASTRRRRASTDWLRASTRCRHASTGRLHASTKCRRASTRRRRASTKCRHASTRRRLVDARRGLVDQNSEFLVVWCSVLCRFLGDRGSNGRDRVRDRAGIARGTGGNARRCAAKVQSSNWEKFKAERAGGGGVGPPLGRRVAPSGSRTRHLPRWETGEELSDLVLCPFALCPFGTLPLCHSATVPLRHSATASLVHPRPPLVAVLHSAP